VSCGTAGFNIYINAKSKREIATRKQWQHVEAPTAHCGMQGLKNVSMQFSSPRSSWQCPVFSSTHKHCNGAIVARVSEGVGDVARSLFEAVGDQEFSMLAASDA